MLRITEIKLPLDHSEAALVAAVAQKLKLSTAPVFTVFKRGVDARKKAAIHFVYTVDVELPNAAAAKALLATFAGDPHVSPTPDTDYKFVGKASSAERLRPVVIGTGPCGLFAALILAQMGYKPLILERGKIVRERTKDTWGFWRKSVLNTASNVQYGEGGAGTFSDGKLYSQIKDPKHYGRKVLTEFVKAGAPPEIMYVSKPHIGTFRLVKMVEHMRGTIESLGGEFRFQTRVDDVLIEQGKMRGLLLENGETLRVDHVVLAIGHSARDTFHMLHKRGVYVEAKPFSVGFRVEHPQGMIDRARWGPFAGNDLLGAADYKLVHHASNARSVYSFCMCPGGTVVAATSEEGRVVTNGMSQYSRNERNANAAIVCGIDPKDYAQYAQDYAPDDPLRGVGFQRFWESRAFELGGATYDAPGQLVGDFVMGRASKTFGSVLPSYKPGVHLTDLTSALPPYAIEAIREAFPAFDKQIKGFNLHDAVLTGVETRTSSPIRIKRHDDTLQSMNTEGLFPAGEGAGYAGGILSAAVDGIRVAEAVALAIAREH